jgi:hypothetical protein
MSGTIDPNRVIHWAWLPEGTTYGEYTPAREEAVRIAREEFALNDPFTEFSPIHDAYAKRARELTLEELSSRRRI